MHIGRKKNILLKCIFSRAINSPDIGRIYVVFPVIHGIYVSWKVKKGFIISSLRVELRVFSNRDLITRSVVCVLASSENDEMSFFSVAGPGTVMSLSLGPLYGQWHHIVMFSFYI